MERTCPKSYVAELIPKGRWEISIWGEEKDLLDIIYYVLNLKASLRGRSFLQHRHLAGPK